MQSYCGVKMEIYHKNRKRSSQRIQAQHSRTVTDYASVDRRFMYREVQSVDEMPEQPSRLFSLFLSSISHLTINTMHWKLFVGEKQSNDIIRELALTTAFVWFVWMECKQRAEREKKRDISTVTQIFGDIHFFSFLPVSSLRLILRIMRVRVNFSDLSRTILCFIL